MRLEASLARRDARISWLKKSLKTLRRSSPPMVVRTADQQAHLWIELQNRAELIASLEELIKENVDRWSDFEIDLLDRDGRINELESDLAAASAVIRSLEDDLQKSHVSVGPLQRAAGLFRSDSNGAAEVKTGTE